jgi:hypothetical protein
MHTFELLSILYFRTGLTSMRPGPLPGDAPGFAPPARSRDAPVVLRAAAKLSARLCPRELYRRRSSLPGSLIPCSYCRERPQEKLSQVTWAWSPRPGERMAYRQRLCVTCFCTNVIALDREIEPTGPLTCPVCGESVERDMDPVYATAFVPGTGKITFQFPLCGTHAVDVRVRAQTNAEFLPERDPVSRGLAPGNAPPVSAWDALGIVPHE